MWGNVYGWIISLVMVIAAVAFAAYLQSVDITTAPSSFSRDAIVNDAIVLPIPPRNLLPDLTGPDDASASVTKAIDAYLADKWTYDRAAQGNIPDNFDSLPAIAPLIDAAMSKSDTLLTPLAAKVVTFKNNRPELDALWSLGSAIIRAGMKREDTDPAGAVGYYNAVLALGAKMCRERLVFGEFSAGMALMGDASGRLVKLVKSKRRLDALAKFDVERRQYVDAHVMPVWQVLSSVDSGIVAQHAGDIPVIALNSKERMWRVEAVLALGRYKYFAPKPRDKRKAIQLLDKLAAEEGDPIVKQAAIAARDMTVEEFRMLR